MVTGQMIEHVCLLFVLSFHHISLCVYIDVGRAVKSCHVLSCTVACTQFALRVCHLLSNISRSLLIAAVRVGKILFLTSC